jgi:hypothetical protein
LPACDAATTCGCLPTTSPVLTCSCFDNGGAITDTCTCRACPLP